MGFLKKKSLTTSGKMMSPARSVASMASRMSMADFRDDVSSCARESDRSRCDSDSFASQAKIASTPLRDHRRNDSLSSLVNGSATTTKVQKTQQRPTPTTTKTKTKIPPPKLAAPMQSSRSAPVSVARGQHAAKGRSNHKSPKQEKLAPKRWVQEDVRSESSLVSSDDSDDDSDDSEDDSDGDTDGDTEDDGHTTSSEESTMYTKGSGSYESDGDDSTNTDNYASLESKTTEEIDDFKENESHHRSKTMSSPKIVDIMEKLVGVGGRKAKREDGKEVIATAAAGPLTLKAPPEDPDYNDFLKEMESFTVKNPEHQLMVQVTEHGNIDKLLIQEKSFIPKANRPSDVVVKIDCSTITLQDCMIRRGKWYDMRNLPFIPGSDFVGIVHEIGAEASKIFQVGDRVAALSSSGGNAKYITVEYSSLIRVPPGVDSDVAVSLCSTYVPARESLDLGRKMNTPFTGANILIVGGNGPIGLATIELALLEGANVFATADERHHQHLTKLGVTCYAIDPTKWLPTLKGKMDVVLDSVCLDGFKSSSLALNSTGIMVCTGMSSVYTQGAVAGLFMKDVRDITAMYIKTSVKFMWDNARYYDRTERFASAPNEYAQHFRYLCHLASKGTIAPLISTRVPLNKIAYLQRAIEKGDSGYGICICEPFTTPVSLVAE